VKRGFLSVHAGLCPPPVRMRETVAGDREMLLCFLGHSTVWVSGYVLGVFCVADNGGVVGMEMLPRTTRSH